MKKEKCIICLQEWGKRSCQIREFALICPRCCAGIRAPSSCDGCSHFVQAEKYQTEKQKKSGFRDFIAEINPEVDAAVDKALAVLESGDVMRAEELMREIVKDYPRLHMVQYGMGVVHVFKEEYEESIVRFEKAVEIFPYFPEAWFNKSNAHKNLLDIANAIKSSRKVVEYGDPKDRFVKDAKMFLRDLEKDVGKDSGMGLDDYLANMEAFDAAFAKMENGAFGEAKEGFLGVLEKDPKHVQSFGNLALCYSFLGERQQALDAFDQALMIDPTYAPALQNKAILTSLPEGENLPSNQFQTIDCTRMQVEEQSRTEKKRRWWQGSSK